MNTKMGRTGAILGITFILIKIIFDIITAFTSSSEFGLNLSVLSSEDYIELLQSTIYALITLIFTTIYLKSGVFMKTSGFLNVFMFNPLSFIAGVLILGSTPWIADLLEKFSRK